MMEIFSEMVTKWELAIFRVILIEPNMQKLRSDNYYLISCICDDFFIIHLSSKILISLFFFKKKNSDNNQT